MKKNPELLLGAGTIVFLLFGTLFTKDAVAGVRKVHELRESGMKTQGTVVDWAKNGIRARRTSAPVIAFTAKDGKEYTFESMAPYATFFGSSDVSTRQQVMVIYSPDAPHVAELADAIYQKGYWLYATTIVAAVIMLLPGLLLLILVVLFLVFQEKKKD